MTQPERLIGEILKENEIKAFTELPSFSDLERFVVIVRTSGNLNIEDYGRAYKTQSYNILLQCYVLGSNSDAAENADKVLEIVDDLFWRDGVENVEFTGFSPLPQMNKHSGYSLSLRLTLNQNTLRR